MSSFNDLFTHFDRKSYIKNTNGLIVIFMESRIKAEGVYFTKDLAVSKQQLISHTFPSLLFLLCHHKL